MKAVRPSLTIFATVLSVLTLCVFVALLGEVPAAVRSASGKTLAKRLSNVRERLAEGFPNRMWFVNLNGLMCRWENRHTCNSVLAIEPDRYLVKPNEEFSDMTEAAKQMADFSAFCFRESSRFLYVQLPKKVDVAGRILPPGYADNANGNADRLMAELRRAGVEAADWRLQFAATPEMVRRNFYRTDPHWTFDAAFSATRLLVRELSDRCGVGRAATERALATLDPDQWIRETLPVRFLGSWGERTGRFFAGTDELTVLRPKFKTQMAIEIPHRELKINGTFEATNMWRYRKAAESAKSYDTDLYSRCYVGGICPIVRHENQEAPLNLSVLVIADSAFRPMEAFLSAVVRSLKVVDPRRVRPDVRMADLVRKERPAIVVQILNPSSLVVDRLTGLKTGCKIMFEYGL